MVGIHRTCLLLPNIHDDADDVCDPLYWPRTRRARKAYPKIKSFILTISTIIIVVTITVRVYDADSAAVKKVAVVLTTVYKRWRKAKTDLLLHI